MKEAFPGWRKVKAARTEENHGTGAEKGRTNEDRHRPAEWETKDGRFRVVWFRNSRRYEVYEGGFPWDGGRERREFSSHKMAQAKAKVEASYQEAA